MVYVCLYVNIHFPHTCGEEKRRVFCGVFFLFYLYLGLGDRTLAGLVWQGLLSDPLYYT